MNEKPITRYVDTDTSKFKELSRGGLVAAFLYSANVMSGGEIKKLDPNNTQVRCVAVSCVLHLPECFFADFAGAKTLKSDDTLEISANGNTLVFKLNDKKYLHNGKEKALSMPMIEENGHFYLPAQEVSCALGVSAGSFASGKLFVIADKAILDEIDNDDNLAYSGCFAVLGEYRPQDMTHEQFVKTKEKWREFLVGSERLNLTGNPDMLVKLEQISARCEEVYSSMHREPDAVILWGDNPPKDSCDLTAQYSRIWAMTLAYAAPGTRFYKDEKIKEAILYGLRWMYENMYGEAEIEGRGWRDVHEFNWWDWHVGAIEPFTDTLIVMEEYLTLDEIKTYLRCYDYVCTFMRTGYRRDVAASRIRTGCKEALLIEDGEMLYNRFLDWDLQFEEVEGTRGKYTDFCRWEHTFPYNLMYGLGNLRRTVYVGTALVGTPAEFPAPFIYEMFTLVRYMFEASIYKGQGFSIFRGRGNGGAELDFGAEAMAGVLNMIGLYGEDEDRYLKTMIKRNARDPYFKDKMISFCTLYNLATLSSIFDDDSIPSEVDYEMTHAWFTAERIAHHRKNFGFLLAMPSSRHPNYESINSANKTGWYTGDGGLYLYTDTDNRSFDGENFISNINVAYRIPGTTEDDRERKVWSFRRGWRSTKDFAGCMDFEEKYGVGAFDYEPYHHEGHEADGTVDDGYGGGFVYHENDLTAKKSYFFFDEECVCLGADISSTMNANVLTTVEHRRLVKDGESGAERVIADDENILSDVGSVTLESPSYVHLEGFAGYVFPEAQNVYASKYEFNRNQGIFDHYFRDGGGKADSAVKHFFELRIEHGKNPKDAKYEYIILPAATPEATKEYAASPKVTVKRNDERVQSVEKASIGVTSTVFYAAESFDGITTDTPCIIMTEQLGDSFKLSVCEPTQLAKEGKIIVERKLKCTKHSRELTVDTESLEGKTVIIANFDNLAGKNLVAEFTLA